MGAGLLMMWMVGTWYVQGPTGDVMKDVNGVALTVGATVKLVGTITSLNANDPHFGDVAITLLHPNGTDPKAAAQITAYPLQLVVGS